jgi:hypothetical protein
MGRNVSRKQVHGKKSAFLSGDFVADATALESASLSP